MNLQQLKVFVYAVKYEKLYVVAYKLHIKQPTVTFHLNKLQEDLGVTLFKTKSYHNIRLTEAGEALYEYAKTIIFQSDEIESLMLEYKNMSIGHLSIASNHTPATYMIMPHLSQLKEEYENISIYLDVKPTHIVIQKIKDFEIDLGIINAVEFEDDDLVFERYQKDDLVITYYPGHPFEKYKTLKPEYLSDYAMIHHEKASVTRKLFDDWAEKNNVDLQVSIQTSGSEAIKHAVMLKMGFGVLSETLIENEVRRGELLKHSIPEWTHNRQIYMIRRRDKIITPTMKVFMEKLSDEENKR